MDEIPFAPFRNHGKSLKGKGKLLRHFGRSPTRTHHTVALGGFSPNQFECPWAMLVRPIESQLWDLGG